MRPGNGLSHISTGLIVLDRCYHFVWSLQMGEGANSAAVKRYQEG